MEESPPSTAHAPSHEAAQSGDRRGFLAGVIGTLLGLFPFGAGLAVLFDPLRRRSQSNGFLRVATLDSVPDDGMARQFPVIADRKDAWNNYLNEPVGAVYLRRKQGSQVVEALNAICPHAGCFVDFNMDAGEFQCPCHNSSFSADGVRIDPDNCPSPRDMDSLLVESKERAVWVEFKDFVIGSPDKEEK